MATIFAEKETVVTSETLTAPTLTGAIAIGTASDTIGFFGATAVAKQTGADQTALTDNSGGTKNSSTGISANMVKQTMILPVQLADISGTFTYSVAVPFAFQVTACGFRPNRLPTTASKTATLQVKVNGSSVTGGLLTLTTAGVTQTGVINNFSAISAANSGTAGQTIDIAATSVTAFVEGDGQFEFTVVNTDLANGFATVVAQNTAFRTALVNLGLIRGT